MPSAKTKRAKNKHYYQRNADRLKSQRKDNYLDKKDNINVKARARYQANAVAIRRAARANKKAQYEIDPVGKRSQSRAESKARQGRNPNKFKSTSRAYYARHKEDICAYKRDKKYILAESRPCEKDQFVKEIQSKLLCDAKAKKYLIKAFKKQSGPEVKRVNVKTAVQKLREINWLYSEVKDDSVDEVSKKVIEISNNASITMLDKADEHDISGFHYYKS